MVAVVIDTSVAKGAGWKSARTLSLLALAKNGSIELYIPETAYHELRTQWREEYEKHFSKLHNSLKALRNAPLLPSAEKTILEALNLEAQKATMSEGLSLSTFEALCIENNIEVRKCTPDHMARAWASYFKGEPPFGSVKDRNDLPDAHIFETIKDLAAEKPGLFILSADARLSKACATLPDVTIFGKIDDLLNDPIVKKAEHETKLTKHWDCVKASLASAIDDEIIDFMHANAGDFLPGAIVRDRSIPSDNNDASITMYGNIENIEIIDKDELVKGYISCLVTFTSECLLDFYVSKWDAFDVPDWVSVSGGDPEEEHYFEAEGEREVSGTIELTLRVNLRENYDDGEPIFEDIQISGKPELHITAE